MKFDFDSDSSEPEKKVVPLNQTQKNYFFNKHKNSTIAEVADEDDEESSLSLKEQPNSGDDDKYLFPLQQSGESLSQTKKLFMNT